MNPVKRKAERKRLPALVLLMGISVLLQLSALTGKPEPDRSGIYISPYPPGAVSYKNVIRIGDTEINQVRFLTGRHPLKVIYKGKDEFFVYTSGDGFHFFPCR